MSFHLQRESISGVQPPEQSKRRRAIQNKDIKRNLFKLRRLHIPTYLGASVCESICEAGGNKIKYTECPRAKPVLRLPSVCCLQLQRLPEDSIRPPVLLTNCISLQVRSEECLTQHAIIHLSCSDLPCCSCPRMPPTTTTLPPSLL